MNYINEQLKSTRVWIKQIVVLLVFCNQMFLEVLDALHMSNPEYQNVCITFAKKASHDTMKKVTDEVTTTGNVRHKTVVKGGTMDIGFVSVMNNMNSVGSKRSKYRSCDEYAAAAVMVFDHNIKELFPDKLHYTIVETPERENSTK